MLGERFTRFLYRQRGQAAAPEAPAPRINLFAGEIPVHVNKLDVPEEDVCETPLPVFDEPELPATAPMQTPPSLPLPKLDLVAHFSGLGDRAADALGWTGDADNPRRIEGFTLNADLPDWRAICVCRAVLPDGTLGPAIPGGTYCGTRGKSQPLHGFVLTVPQDRPDLANMCYEGRFQDGFRSQPLPAGEICRSPGNAVLVGMRVAARIETAEPEPVLPPLQKEAGDDRQHDRGTDPDPHLAELAPRHNGVAFMVPTDLSRTPTVLRRVALIGSCFLQAWNLHGRHAAACAFDVFTVNHAAKLPDKPSPDTGIEDYDFQIVQLSMRSFFHDDMLTKLAYADIEAHEQALEDAAQRMAFQLSCSLKWNIDHGLLTFVTNFPLPQRNAFGILFPRFDIRNPEHFVYLLNQRLENLVRSYRHAHVLDVDRIAASFGRRYIQDDIVSTTSHNSILGLRPPDWNRIEPMAGLGAHYDVTWGRFLADAIWAEALCMYRVVRQDDSVKLVIVDLDDTLWQGVSGDMDHIDGLMVAGWPEGLAEALLYLKKRGILLAIVSKNEEARIRAIWRRIFGSKLALEDFSAIRINWQPKAGNIAEILSLVNLLPRNAVFIDDNPAERAAVQAAFADMRILGRNPYYLRRILLWSSETQSVAISAESGRRTEMVQAQILREETRGTVSRDAFLAAAAPHVTLAWLDGAGDQRFARAFELLNKTNQFNTTGKRWTDSELRQFLQQGGGALVFEVTDSFTAYGLVGVVLVQGRCIEQWVMSCRVLGLDIEIAVMAQIRQERPGDITGRLLATDANFPCRDLFEKCGFTKDGDLWRLPEAAALNMPSHIEL